MLNCAVIKTNIKIFGLPPLLGLQHALQCRKDFSVVIYCHELDGNYMAQLRGLTTDFP
jgi:hypothetical protein